VCVCVCSGKDGRIRRGARKIRQSSFQKQSRRLPTGVNQSVFVHYRYYFIVTPSSHVLSSVSAGAVHQGRLADKTWKNCEKLETEVFCVKRYDKEGEKRKLRSASLPIS
jgi:hypothetical protein